MITGNGIMYDLNIDLFSKENQMKQYQTLSCVCLNINKISCCDKQSRDTLYDIQLTYYLFDPTAGR